MIALVIDDVRVKKGLLNASIYVALSLDNVCFNKTLQITNLHDYYVSFALGVFIK